MSWESADPRLEAHVAVPLVGPEPRLSAAETMVLAHSAAGLTDQEIAHAMERSLYQVKYSARNAMTRLGAQTRAHAVAIAVCWGLIDVRRTSADAESITQGPVLTTHR